MVDFMPLVILGFASAIVYQTVLRDLLFTTIGLHRDLQPVSDFPFTCRRLSDDPLLRACEDMWLSEDTRQLFLACSTPEARSRWTPNIGRFNATGRSLQDVVLAMDIDAAPTSSSSYPYRKLSFPDFAQVSSDGRLHVVGFTGVDSSTTQDGNIHLYFVNAQPFVDPVTRQLLNNTKTGANATIESFAVTGFEGKSSELKHLRTFKDRRIATPNNVAVVGDGEFYITNDHGSSTSGLLHTASSWIGTGDVTYHGADGTTKQVRGGFRFPNGLVRGTDGLIYVPSVIDGGITVFEPLPGGSVKEISHIPIPCPIDNLSVDRTGAIFAAGLPKVLAFMQGFDDPYNAAVPARVYKITKSAPQFALDARSEKAWVVEKVLDDKHAEVLPPATVAVHDETTGRIFLSGIYAPYVTVCEPR